MNQLDTSEDKLYARRAHGYLFGDNGDTPSRSPSFTISVRIGNRIAIRYFCFNDIYPFCIHKERHLITLVVFFLILHIVDSDNSLFSRNNDVFLLVLRIKYVKHLCNRCSENPRFIFMTHICQVNDCEPIIIDLNTLWVLHPLTFKYRDS
jgi:hypothetical protein